MLASMQWEMGRRGAAIGVVYGIAAAAETLRITPALRDGPGSVAPALEIVALFVCVYAAIGLAGGAAVALLGALGRRIGLPAFERLGSGRALWPVALLLIAFNAFNESMRGVPLLEEWRHPIRAALIAFAALALLRALRRDVRTPMALRAFEATLALLLLPALVGLVAYAMRPLPEAAGDATTAGLLALAPHFDPEPPEAFARTRDTGRPRVLLIGIDGASWDRIDRGIAAGRLPTFARLKSDAVTAPLLSVVPTYSPPIWTSMMTGVPASEHGIEDFYLTQLTRLGVENLHLRRAFSPVRRVLDAAGELRFVPVTSSLRRRKAIWNLADEAGLRSAVIGLWATWPPEMLQHGAVVSDHASLARQHEWLDRGKSNRADPGVTMYPPALQQQLAALQRSPDSVTREELATLDRGRRCDLARVRADARILEGGPALRVPLESPERRLLRARRAHDLERRPPRSARALPARRRRALAFLRGRERARSRRSRLERARHPALRRRRRPHLRVDRSRHRPARGRSAARSARAARDRLRSRLGERGRRPLRPQRCAAGNPDPRWRGCLPGRLPGARTPTIFDVAPTLLAQLGLPLSSELVGHPLNAAFEEEKPIVAVAAYGAPQDPSRAVSSGADPQMREKLEALGYTRK